MPHAPPRTAEQRAHRDKEVRKVLVIELLLNILVAIAKGVYGLISGSLSITADAIHSAVDAGANLIGLFVMHKSTKPPDPDFPYGRRKLEVVAATALGASVAIAGISLGVRSVEALLGERQPAETSLLGVLVIGGTLLVNLFVASYEARKAKELQSTFLAADAAHTAGDILVTLAVLISFLASHYGLHWADSVGALIVVAFILRIAWHVITDNFGLLLDQAHLDEAHIRELALSVEGIESCHRVRSRGMPDEVMVDLHLQADGAISLARSHDLSHQVESLLRESFPSIVDVTIHMEPTGDPVDEL